MSAETSRRGGKGSTLGERVANDLLDRAESILGDRGLIPRILVFEPRSDEEGPNSFRSAGLATVCSPTLTPDRPSCSSAVCGAADHARDARGCRALASLRRWSARRHRARRREQVPLCVGHRGTSASRTKDGVRHPRYNTQHTTYGMHARYNVHRALGDARRPRRAQRSTGWRGAQQWRSAPSFDSARATVAPRFSAQGKLHALPMSAREAILGDYLSMSAKLRALVGVAGLQVLKE